MLDHVTTILENHQIPGEAAGRFVLIVSEAITNAMVHGNRSDSRKTIKLTICVNDEHLTADIIDEGHGGLEKIRNRRPPTLLSEGGRGVDLMEHYASAIAFTETAGGGLHVSVRVDLKTEKTR